MPTNPESEGSRLITLKQIEQEHGIGRSSLHSYRRRPTFPQPVPVEGSTKILYRADEVAAWFEANPPQQGKRTDLAPNDEGAAMPQTETQQTEAPALSADARAVLAIVWKWIADANDGLGGDVGDLQYELESAGYGPVEEAQDG
ncbi:helix-turn-helix transcriptional regulator [Streptomyces werraensis]|uniref:helix-turn-helix transcriptional regulator n=1 Tax=Streptomyces werraensis TaxID=68284 RepID=UPI00367DAB20